MTRHVLARFVRAPRIEVPLFALFLMASLGAADDTKPRPQLAPAVRALLESARTTPPEFFADIAIRLVTAGKVPQPELQAELLEEAFIAAGRAQQPVRVIAVPGLGPDTRALYRSKAGELRLDATSLQSRILKELLTVDRGRARSLFARAVHPVVDPRPCEDPLVDDASAYYDTVGPLAQSAFTAAEKEKEQHVQFLISILAGARSPLELAAFARSLQSVALTAEERSLLTGALAVKLTSIGADYRSFALSVNTLRSEIEQLTDSARAEGLEITTLARGFRQYLVAQMTAPRCQEDFGDGAAAVQWFNSRFGDALPSILEDETKPSSRGGALKTDSYFAGDSKRIGDALSRMRGIPSEGSPSQSVRGSAQWRNLLTDFLRDFTSWQPLGSDEDAFHQKATVMRALLELTPSGDDREGLITLSVELVQSARAQQDSPAEWLWEVKALVEAARLDAPKMLQAFSASGNVSLSLYPLLAANR